MATTYRENFEELIKSENGFFTYEYNQKPVVIYGAGQMGLESSVYLRKAGIKIECFIDKNPKIEGMLINGIPVINPEKLTCWQKINCIFAIAVIKFPYNDIKEYLLNLGCKDVCYIGHVLENVYKHASIANVWYFNNIKKNEIEMMRYSLDKLADDNSKMIFLQLLNWILYGEEKLCDTNTDTPDNKYFPKVVMDILNETEIFVDCGAYTGNSIERIEKFTRGNYSEIHSFEPEESNYKALLESVEINPNKTKIKTYPFGLGSEDNKRNFTVGMGLTSRFTDKEEGVLVQMHKLDTVMIDKKYSFLRIYGLGIGWEIIVGGIKTIKMYRPIIAINIHHSREDFVKIPYILSNELIDYSIYLRSHGYCGSEAVIYAIPHERIK